MEALEAKKLYEEYRAVVARTSPIAQIMKPGGNYTPLHLAPEDLVLRKQLHAELKQNHMSWIKANLDPGSMWDFEHYP